MVTKPDTLVEVDLKKKNKYKPSVFTRFLVTLLLMLGVFVLAMVITYTATVFIPKRTPQTFDECVNSKSSTIQASYPSICTTKDGGKFVQPLSAEEQRLLEAKIKNAEENPETVFCGGIAGISCPSGFTCKLDGSYPDAGGTCLPN